MMLDTAHPITAAYYINLDFRTDRRDHMERELGRTGWEYHRVNAIRLSVDPWEAGLPLRRHLKKHPHVGSIYMSHDKTLNAIEQNDRDGIFAILEDDVSIDFNEARRAQPFLPPDLPENWDTCLISPRFKRQVAEGKWGTAQSPLTFSARNAKDFAGEYKVTGAHFVLVNGKGGARRVLRKMKDLWDWYDIDYWYQDNTECYLWQDDAIGTSRDAGESNHADAIASAKEASAD